MEAVTQNAGEIAAAFWVTIKLFLYAGAGALVLGMLLAAMRVSPIPPLQWAARLYVQVVRNTPLTLILLALAFGVPQLDIVFDFFTFAVIGLWLYTAAFVAEAVRSGINAVPIGQAEAARSIGLTFGQTLRLVVLPQAFRTVIPPLGSVYIALLKNTSVASAIGVLQAMQEMAVLANRNGDQVLQILAAFALIYAALALVLSAIFRVIERRLEVAR
jgi:glutamate transport system permease protein